MARRLRRVPVCRVDGPCAGRAQRISRFVDGWWRSQSRRCFGACTTGPPFAAPRPARTASTSIGRQFLAERKCPYIDHQVVQEAREALVCCDFLLNNRA